MAKYILVHAIGKAMGTEIKWYVNEVNYNDETYPESDWVLGSVLSQERNKAMKFTNKRKAEEVARILSSQVDECGCSPQYHIEEV